jgi:protein SCO1/2
MSRKAFRLAGLTAALAAALYCPSLLAQQDDAQHQGHDMSTMDANAPADPHAGHDMSAMDPNAPVDPHAHHHADMEAKVMRSMVDVKIAATPLVRQDGARTTLAKELGGKKPTVLAFIYTSCTTVCPVTSQILSRTQDLLGADLAKARIVSISIDPEYDTPQRLTAYAEKFGALPQWQHYTGSLANSVAVQKAFGAFRGDKMNHVPLFFINGGGKADWVQLEGFPSAEQLVKEFREQAGS